MLNGIDSGHALTAVATVRDAVDDTLAIMKRFESGEDVPHEEVEAARRLWDEQITRTSAPPAPVFAADVALVPVAHTSKDRAARWLQRNGITGAQTKLRSFNTTQRPRLALKPRKGAH
jgi:hypothetical protein